jgi:putative sterol carrier protein
VVAKFMSAEWLEALIAALNSHEGFTGATANTEMSLLFNVPDAPEDVEDSYFLQIANGAATGQSGGGEDADVTITNNYETAVAISKGELNTQMAFMTGKIKVDGNMAKLMMNQAALAEFANASAGLEVEY